MTMTTMMTTRQRPMMTMTAARTKVTTTNTVQHRKQLLDDGGQPPLSRSGPTRAINICIIKWYFYCILQQYYNYYLYYSHPAIAAKKVTKTPYTQRKRLAPRKAISPNQAARILPWYTRRIVWYFFYSSGTRYLSLWAATATTMVHRQPIPTCRMWKIIFLNSDSP